MESAKRWLLGVVVETEVCVCELLLLRLLARVFTSNQASVPHMLRKSRPHFPLPVFQKLTWKSNDVSKCTVRGKNSVSSPPPLLLLLRQFSSQF